MPRLFTGIEIPNTHANALSLLQAGLKGVRWIEPSDFHITLRFIGDVSLTTADDIVEVFSSRLWRAPEIELGELKCFGGSTPNSLYASVKESLALSNLVKTQERILQQLGLPAESRRFTPHVTLARCKGLSAEQVARYLGGRAGYLTPPPFKPRRFVLYSARESTGGGPYRVENVWEFNTDP